MRKHRYRMPTCLMITLVFVFVYTVLAPMHAFAAGKAANDGDHADPFEPGVLTIHDQTSSVLYLHEVRSLLGYLPLSFRATVPTDAVVHNTPQSPAIGEFDWNSPNTPLSLRKEWVPTRYNVLTKGAVTHIGTYVIYLRNRKQTMEGMSPRGTRYRWRMCHT